MDMDTVTHLEKENKRQATLTLMQNLKNHSGNVCSVTDDAEIYFTILLQQDS